MSKEASKTKLLCPQDILPYLKGEGIDIGCGPDPILPTVDKFDKKDGDANEITNFVSKKYDFVFASHSLEHMKDPQKAILEWLKLLKNGGYLVVLVPDEDLFEQGVFPSIFNPDHKFTFTISKTNSWSPCSINVLDLIKSLKGELISVKLQDAGYDRSLQYFGYNRFSYLLWKLTWRIGALLPGMEKWSTRLMRKLGSVIDQTALVHPALAQICFVIRKTE